MGALLSIGHGYSARVFGRFLLGSGWKVAGTTRSPEKAREMEESGVEPAIWPGSDISGKIGDATHLLASVPPGEDGDPFLDAYREALREAAGNLEWVGYLSTTAVYGDRAGGFVDESSETRPATRRGMLRLEAERQWLELLGDLGLPVHVFRLAGIYGPGRGPLQKVLSGAARRIVKRGQVFNRIHVEDICGVLAASVRRPNPGAVYNVCDDEACPPEEVMEFAARLLGVEPPPLVDFEKAEMSPLARSFYAESKRVRNSRIKDELGVRLRHPTYREGLEAISRSLARRDSG